MNPVALATTAAFSASRRLRRRLGLFVLIVFYISIIGFALNYNPGHPGQKDSPWAAFFGLVLELDFFLFLFWVVTCFFGWLTRTVVEDVREDYFDSRREV